MEKACTVAVRGESLSWRSRSILSFSTPLARVLGYGVLFQNEPERAHFPEYLTGLFVAEKQNVSAISNYVCPSGKHYPLAFHRFIKEEQCRRGL